MKTNSINLQIAALLTAALLFGGPAFGQPGVIDPHTGMPKSSGAKPGAIDAATGLRAGWNPETGLLADDENDISPPAAMRQAFATGRDVHDLMYSLQYEEALKRCLAFRDKFKAAGALGRLLPEWAELGRRFPKAKAALLEIRDRDVSEFSEGRAYSDLFSEINSINDVLGQDDATFSLFKSFRDKDPGLARQCYPVIEGLLAARGEYQWCYDHMGDPRQKFESIHRSLTWKIDNQKRLSELMESNRQRMAEIHQRLGQTNLPVFTTPDHAVETINSANDDFVNETRRLLEILVATGHKTEAERISAQAVTIVNDPRLKSAVSDVAEKSAK